MRLVAKFPDGQSEFPGVDKAMLQDVLSKKL
jgi:hypothetical protein